MSHFCYLSPKLFYKAKKKFCPGKNPYYTDNISSLLKMSN